MKKINLPPFYVGQRVVAVKSHREGFFKKGDKFTISGIRPGTCKCIGNWIVSIGKPIVSKYRHCTVCHTHYMEQFDGMIWFKSVNFAPIQENFQSISLEKVLEQETKLISVN